MQAQLETKPSAKTEINEILQYKRKLQAFLIYFENANQLDMLQKLNDADELLDFRLKQILN